MLLGRVRPAEEDGERERLARAEAQRQRDLALVMPGPLPMAERDAYRYVSLLVGKWRSLLASSPMNTGKTSAVIKLLVAFLFKRVIFVTPRVVYAIALHAMLVGSGFKDARLYLNEGTHAIAEIGEQDAQPLAATLSSSTTLRYADIPPLAPDATTLSVLSARVRTKRASEVEQAQFDRWCFSHFVGGDNAELRARLYDEVWTQPAKRHWLRNLRAEKRGLAASEAEFRAREAGKESAFVGKTLDQLLAIQELCEELGVANTGTAAVVTRSALISAATPDDLERRMELRPAQGRGRSSELRLKLSIFSRALEAWSGARLMCGPRARRRVDGKVLDASDFRLVPALDGAAWAALSP